MSNIKIKQIINAYNAGVSVRNISKQFNVSASTVSKYINLYSEPRRNNINYDIYQYNDEDFIKIINESNSWDEIGAAFNNTNGKIKSFQGAIIKRCKQLNISYPQRKFVLNITKGELFSKRHNWWSASTNIRKLARQIYLNSNKPKCCAICGYTNCFEVAHIKPVSDFPDNTLVKVINNINNLVALCPNHHWEYDHGIINSETLKTVHTIND